ncbi:MAG: hypothetical protein JNL82_17730 [Myxococcales bacterium]|nr:hypothetical protein [Myxococcales bacterium]
MIRLTEFLVREPRFRTAVAGAAAVWLFAVPGLLLAGLLTLLRVRAEVRCDDPYFGACVGPSACEKVLTDAWATVLGLPLTVYAAGFFVVMLALAGAMVARPGLSAALRPALLTGAWAGVLVCAVLATYAAVWLQALCLYCLFLDGTCVGVLLAAMLADRGRVAERPRAPATWIVLAAAGLLFVAAVLGQRLVILRAHAAATAGALHPCVVAMRELETPALRVALTDQIEPPVYAVGLFLDLSCAHCRAEYTLWRGYQRELADRGVPVELQLFHFPRGCSTAAGAPDASRTRACDAARAQLCLAGTDSEQALRLFDRLLAEQDGPFTSDRLAALAAEFGGTADASDPDSPLFVCMRGEEVAATLARHASFAAKVGDLHAAPGVLVVPLVDGRPQGQALRSQGHKPREFYEAWFARHGGGGDE